VKSKSSSRAISARHHALGRHRRADVFKEFTETLGKSGEEKWQLRGGHRIWPRPKTPSRPTRRDTGPVHISVQSAVLEATQPVERSPVRKQIIVKMSSTAAVSRCCTASQHH